MALGKNFHFWTTFLVATEAALCITLGEIDTQKCLALCVMVVTIQFGSVLNPCRGTSASMHNGNNSMENKYIMSAYDLVGSGIHIGKA